MKKKTSPMTIGSIKTGAKNQSASAKSTAKTVVFGQVEVSAQKVSSKTKKRNVTMGNTAISRAATTLREPGVSLNAAPGVPLFFADETDPALIVRILNGQSTRGKIEGGKFKIVK